MFSALAGQGQIYVHLNDGIWSQIKSAGYGETSDGVSGG